MPFVSKNQGDEERRDDVAAGAPPGFPTEFDPNDPDAVKVHYDLGGWGVEQRAELAETLAELGLPHVWDGDELVAPEAAETFLDQVFERLEAELGPFPVALEPGEPAVEYGLDEWPADDLAILGEALVEAEIPHRWSGDTLVVAADAESAVDDLLDAIESGDIAVIDGTAPDGVLGELHRAADRLARDPGAGGALDELRRWRAELAPERPPFGMGVQPWRIVLAHLAEVTDAFDAGGEPVDLSLTAEGLRDHLRDWV